MFNEKNCRSLLSSGEALVYKLMSPTGNEERYGAVYFAAPNLISHIPRVKKLNELAMFLAYTRLLNGEQIESLVKNPFGLTRDGNYYVGALSKQEQAELTALFAKRIKSKPNKSRELSELVEPFSHRMGEEIVTEAEGVIEVDFPPRTY
ncbi:MAG: hypothetical protein AABW48_02855 [Nanoarchaeota archaeon]